LFASAGVGVEALTGALVSALTGFDGKAAGTGAEGALAGSLAFLAGRAYGDAFGCAGADFSGTAAAFVGSEVTLAVAA